MGTDYIDCNPTPIVTTKYVSEIWLQVVEKFTLVLETNCIRQLEGKQVQIILALILQIVTTKLLVGSGPTRDLGQLQSSR